MSKLNGINISHAVLSDRIVLARLGKDPSNVLETKDAHSEFLQCLVSYAFDGVMPKMGGSAEFEFGGGDEQFIVRVTRKDVAKKEVPVAAIPA